MYLIVQSRVTRSVQDVETMCRGCQSLKHLSLQHNPLTKDRRYRAVVINSCPQLGEQYLIALSAKLQRHSHTPGLRLLYW